MMQGVLLLTQAFKRLHACHTDCVIIAPLCRLAAFLALGRKLKPQTPKGVTVGRGGWQATIHNSCQAHVITCLEHLADLPSGMLSLPKNLIISNKPIYQNRIGSVSEMHRVKYQKSDKVVN